MAFFGRQTDSRHATCGFTLIELLVVIAVIAVLLGILLPTLGYARRCVLMSGEMSAGRQLIAAHAMYANESDSFVMPGYPSNGMVSSGQVIARDDTGERITTPVIARRYPWRLMPYLEYQLGILYRSREAIDEQLSGVNRQYAVSLAPRMGLNQTFVGGSSDTDGTGLAFGSPAAEALVRRRWGSSWYVRKTSDAPRPSELIVFATASEVTDVSGVKVDGNYRVTPPYFTARRWTTTPPDQGSTASQTGSVSFQYHNKAAAAFMDGSARGLDWNEMQDMRHWSPQATGREWVLPRL